MCDTCGCENNDNVRIYKPDNEHEHHHSHDSLVPHHHHHNEHSHREISVEQDILSKIICLQNATVAILRH